MPRHLKSSTVVIALLAAGLVLSACASGSTREERRQALNYQERPVDMLYNIASGLLDVGQNAQAILYFREVERQHPYSEWARRSIMMSAYASYRDRDYHEAVAESDRFIQLYPGNPSAAYAYYIKALCYFEQIVDVGRDQGNAEAAQGALRDVIRRYPGSEYAVDAKIKLELIDDQLAGKEMTVGRFYLRQGNTLAAINRFKNVIDRYQTTSHTPEALYRMVEAYLTLGVVDEANRNAAVLGANFPGDQWYADAYALMTDRGIQPTVKPVRERRVRNGFGLFGGKPEAAPPASPGGALPPPKA